MAAEPVNAFPRPARAVLATSETEGGGGTIRMPAYGPRIMVRAPVPSRSGAGATAEPCGTTNRRPVVCSTSGAGATTPDAPAHSLCRAPFVSENGTIGVTALDPKKFGSLAVAALMSGGVTRPGFCSGLTLIAVCRAASCAAARPEGLLFNFECGLPPDARLSAAGNDVVGG